MKRYIVSKYFSGVISYEVMAENEEDAETVANDLFAKESPGDIVNNLELDHDAIEEMED